MAAVVQTFIVSDLDPSQGADSTVRFGLDGQNYEIDLTAAEETQLREALAPYILPARKVTPAMIKVNRPKPKQDSAEIRKWLRANNHPCPQFGRIPAESLALYQSAHK